MDRYRKLLTELKEERCVPSGAACQSKTHSRDRCWRSSVRKCACGTFICRLCLHGHVRRGAHYMS